MNDKKINPTNEIYFFRNTLEDSNLVYVFMSLQMPKEHFYEMFENAEEITEETADVLILHQGREVVYVGDAPIIDRYFKEVKK